MAVEADDTLAEPTTQEHVAALLVDDEPAEVKAPPAQAEEQAATPAESDTAVEAVEEKPAPGTPDKVIQKMQQDLSAATRKMDALLDKVGAGETLTRAEEQEVQKQARKVDAIKAALAEKDPAKQLFDPATAEALLETDDTIQALAREHAALKAELAQIRQFTDQEQRQRDQAAIQARYKGVNVDEVWQNALESSIEMLGISPEEAKAITPNTTDWKRVSNLANRLFHERAGAAAKRVGDTGATPQTLKKTTKPTPPVTPGGASVPKSDSGVTAATPSDPDDHTAYLASIRGLVVDD